MTKAQKERMEHLVTVLNDACDRYYVNTNDGPSMPDIYYDKLITELVSLEETTGEFIPESPTKRVGFAHQEEGKMLHKKPILSLKDTKSIDELLHFLGEREGMLSWKLDGVSIILHYVNGKLVTALTRGDGLIGKVIFGNVLRMRGVPLEIPTKEELVVRGEGCITLSEFDVIKKTRKGEEFSNPRNLAAGIINTTKSPSILLRHVNFIAHSIVYFGAKELTLSKRSQQLDYLTFLGFRSVPYTIVLNFELKREIERYTRNVTDFEFPVDGLVLTLNGVEYGESLGATAKYPKHSLAFKWPDEHKLTRVTGMKWSVSQTGLLTPVVIFEPIELEGTIVKQANLHSLKFFAGLGIGIGDILQVYKANKIIPEVEENLTRSNTEEPPDICPVCGHSTTTVQTEKSTKLYCHYCGGKSEENG